MSTPFESPAGDHDELAQYRALSGKAITALVLAVLSVAALLFAAMLVIPLAGIFVALSAMLSIKNRPDELTGMKPAKAGLYLSLLIFVAATALHVTVYATEVPDGYRRISFRQLQPDTQFSNEPIPPSALELDGAKVFIKGYVYPGAQQRNLKSFVLVPDMRSCCFGGQPKLTDMIEVTLCDPLRVNFSYGRRRLTGVLKVNKQLKSMASLQGVYYELDADYVR